MPVGIGCHLELQGPDIVVARLKPGGSAVAEGLPIGCVLLAVDGISVIGRDLPSARTLIMGEEGTSVSLLIRMPYHPGATGETYIFTLQRYSARSVSEAPQPRQQHGLRLEAALPRRDAQGHWLLASPFASAELHPRAAGGRRRLHRDRLRR